MRALSICLPLLAFAASTPATATVELAPFLYKYTLYQQDPFERYRLDVWGLVHAFEGDLAGLDASEPTIEYSYVLDSTLTESSESHDCNHFRAYAVRMRIFRDDSPDAELLELETFADGELIFEFQLAQVDIDDCLTDQESLIHGSGQATGGTLFALIGGPENAPDASLSGLLEHCPLPDQYAGCSNAALTIFSQALGSRTESWSSLKSRY